MFLKHGGFAFKTSLTCCWKLFQRVCQLFFRAMYRKLSQWDIQNTFHFVFQMVSGEVSRTLPENLWNIYGTISTFLSKTFPRRFLEGIQTNSNDIAKRFSNSFLIVLPKAARHHFNKFLNSFLNTSEQVSIKIKSIPECY